MTQPESFDAMRERLAREGKIERDGAGYRLTPAGNDHSLRLIDELARTEDPDFSVDARVEIPASVAEQHREPFEIGYNGKYLRSLIDATTGEDLVINVADPGSPGSIVDPTADGFRAVLMPMRI